MKHAEQFEAETRVPRWSTPSEARALLDKEIDGFVRAAADTTAEPDAALALKVTAGLGKTATALRIIARYGATLLTRGHVLIHLPTLDLAERAYADFRTLAPELPSRVIRGRDAPRPDDRENKMCERAEIAKKVSGLVDSVTQALCRGQDSDGNFVQSACAPGCPYLQQKDMRGPHVAFLSHAYLTLEPSVDRDYPTALRVVDEKVWPTLTRISHLSINDLMRAPPSSFPEMLRDDLSRAKAALVDGLQRNLPLHDHLRSSGIGSDLLQRLAHAEERSRSKPEIGPGQPAEAVAFRLQTFDTRSFIASRQRQRIFERLSQKEAGHCAGLTLSEMTPEGDSHGVIQSSRLVAVDRDAPLLLLDADANRDITARVAPGAEFISIQSPPVADVVQLSDLTLSNSWLLHPEEGSKRRAAVLTILKREVDMAEEAGVLVVATKTVLEALHADVGNPSDGSDGETLRQPLLGAEPRWFGPRMQGVNDFEGYATIVVIGRLQPGITDIESSARAVFAQDELPIEAHVSGPLPQTEENIIMADGSIPVADLRAHPDPRVQAVLTQSRECSTLQAIARLRLVSPNRAKRVVILSNLPLPEFPVTRLCTFAALERGLEHEPDWQGFIRMEDALRAMMRRPVRGTRLSAAGLAADLPRDFKTEHSARRFRRGRPTSHMISLSRRVAAGNGWKITSILLRRSTGGKPVPAIILGEHGAPLAMAKTLWPDFTPVALR